MNGKRGVQRRDGRRIEGAEPADEPRRIERAHLFGLGFGVRREPVAWGGWDQHLEGMDPGSVACQRHNSDQPTPQPFDDPITGVSRDDDARSSGQAGMIEP